MAIAPPIIFLALRDHLPLQQGLRRLITCPSFHYTIPPRPSSTTTRIKTRNSGPDLHCLHSPRPSSTTTRIKTCHIAFICSLNNLLRDHLPLKQGLRHCEAIVIHFFLNLRDHLPLKQGLRLAVIVTDLNEVDSPRPSSIKTRIKTWLR